MAAPSNQYAQLVEKINRIVRDRGDVELMVLLDRIMERETEPEQAETLGSVVKILNQNKKPQDLSGASSNVITSIASSTASQAESAAAFAVPAAQAPVAQAQVAQGFQDPVGSRLNTGNSKEETDGSAAESS